MNIIDLLTIIMGILVIVSFILGVIGVMINKKRNGSSWIGQGYGRK